MERSYGILMHISSLPSPYGIGTLGAEAREFADFLKAARCPYWQMLPMGPTGFGDSPYQSFSTFAGNPYFIDLREFKKRGLLTDAELNAVDWGDDAERVDYGKVYEGRFALLRKAFARGDFADGAESFMAANPWAHDYALFMAVKEHFGGRPWYDWPDEGIRARRPADVARYRELLRNDVLFYAFLQREFFDQWKALHRYLRELGIRVIGDLPMYVQLDSADVWASTEVFLLDEEQKPTEVAGVPPDYFSPEGQLWGNPLYDWEHLEKTGYAWWLERIEAATRMFDVIRIDHFRALAGYYCVDAAETTAKNGRWRVGPGLPFVKAVKAAFPGTGIIAEDLGLLTDDVHELLEASGFPGMKVLEFAFDANEPSAYLPHNYERNCVCYVGTHDNTTAKAWYDECGDEDRQFARRYLGLSDDEGVNWGLMRAGMGSVADLFVCQMQDVLGLGAEARMNTPGTMGGNWCWRMDAGAALDIAAVRLAEMARMYGR